MTGSSSSASILSKQLDEDTLDCVVDHVKASVKQFPLLGRRTLRKVAEPCVRSDGTAKKLRALVPYCPTEKAREFRTLGPINVLLIDGDAAASAGSAAASMSTSAYSRSFTMDSETDISNVDEGEEEELESSAAGGGR